MREIVQNLKFRKTSGLDGSKLAEWLELQYLKQRREPRSGKKTTFSPSTIGYGHGNCPRYWYLAFEGGTAIDTTDALGIANMANGTQAHERIQKLFRDAEDVLISEELEITIDDPPVRGFADLLINWEGEKVIGEIKTTRQEVWMHRQMTMKPSAQHLIQILLYMKATDVKSGFLLYENKNDQTFLVIPVTMDEKNTENLETVLEWLRRVRKAWEEKEVPKQPYQKRNKICKACPVYDWCWGGAPTGKTLIAPLEPPTP